MNQGAFMSEKYPLEKVKEWAQKLIDNPDLTYRELGEQEGGIPESTIRYALKRIGFSKTENNVFQNIIDKQEDEQVKNTLINLVKSKQKQADILRVERKYYRTKNRLVIALEEYSKELVDIFNKKNISKHTKVHKTSTKEDYAGLIQFTDLHINEQINLSNNKFDISIASKRLQKHVDNAKKIFKSYGVKTVYVAFTGDLMNSNRRTDELLLNATNRANATFVAVDILQQALLDLNQDFNLVCANVTGNESRIEKDIGWINDIAQDNFDFVIYNTLGYLFKGSKGVKFLGPDDTYTEKVLNINNNNVLLLHGHNGFANDTDRKIASKFGQYAQKGINLDYAIFGHIHSAAISDLYARSSGLPGSNNFSQNALNLTGKASQNVYLFSNDKDIHGMKIDLQSVKNYKGYKVSTKNIYDDI